MGKSNCFSLLLIVALSVVIVAGITFIVLLSQIDNSVDELSVCAAVEDGEVYIVDMRNVSVAQGLPLQLQCKVLNLSPDDKTWKVSWKTLNHKSEMNIGTTGLNFALYKKHNVVVDVSGSTFFENYICDNKTIKVPTLTCNLGLIPTLEQQGWYTCFVNITGNWTQWGAQKEPQLLEKRLYLTVI